jgi:hypothetical protein
MQVQLGPVCRVRVATVRVTRDLQSKDTVAVAMQPFHRGFRGLQCERSPRQDPTCIQCFRVGQISTSGEPFADAKQT